MVYDAVIAIIAMLGLDDIGVIAAIGAAILGLGWSLLGVLSKSDSAS
jgi:predicted amino acid-binding ACT domain protein